RRRRRGRRGRRPDSRHAADVGDQRRDGALEPAARRRALHTGRDVGEGYAGRLGEAGVAADLRLRRDVEGAVVRPWTAGIHLETFPRHDDRRGRGRDRHRDADSDRDGSAAPAEEREHEDAAWFLEARRHRPLPATTSRTRSNLLRGRAGASRATHENSRSARVADAINQKVIALTSEATPTAPAGAMSSSTARAPGGRSRRAASSVASRGSLPAATARSIARTPQARCSRRVVSGTRL